MKGIKSRNLVSVYLNKYYRPLLAQAKIRYPDISDAEIMRLGLVGLMTEKYAIVEKNVETAEEISECDYEIEKERKLK